MTIRNQISQLKAVDDIIRVEERVHWESQAPAIASEAAKANGPAVLFENTYGQLRLVSGAYGGPGRLFPRSREPWSRLASAIGLDRTASYQDYVDRLLDVTSEDSSLPRQPTLASTTEVDLYSLGLPALVEDTPTVTLGLFITTAGGDSTWAPIRGLVTGHNELTATIPEGVVAELSSDSEVTVALGVPIACLISAFFRWIGETPIGNPLRSAGALSDVSVSEGSSGLIPASSEVLIHGNISQMGGSVRTPQATWERATATSTVTIEVTGLELRNEAVVPFSPLGGPLSDDVHITSAVESARLFQRVNSYWGITPVRWLSLPVETKLGICVVATDTLYAGFEWQLSNTLFSFSRLFDKILVLDRDTPPSDLARAFDDIWVKAHPSHDWQFSEPVAPSATAPRYRQGEETGSRLYINATWDPHWEDEFIAPRVRFDSFPQEIQQSVREHWTEMGFGRKPTEPDES